jgi:hypothetical protein
VRGGLLSLRHWARVAAISLAGLWCLGAAAMQAEGRSARLAAVAAVIHHVAPRILGDPPEPVYLAYFGKTPPEDLWELVSDISHLEAMPPAWQPGANEGSIELLDVYDVRRGKSGSWQISVQVVAPLGLAVEACTYTARLKGTSWQVDAEATRCLVI